MKICLHFELYIIISDYINNLQMWLHPETMIKLGNEFFQKKEYDQAINWYEQSIKKND